MLAVSLQNRDEESFMLRNRLSEQDQETKRCIDKLKADIRVQIEEAVSSEKRIWEKEQKYVENEQNRQRK